MIVRRRSRLYCLIGRAVVRSLAFFIYVGAMIVVFVLIRQEVRVNRDATDDARRAIRRELAEIVEYVESRDERWERYLEAAADAGPDEGGED